MVRSGFLCGNLNERDHFENLEVDGVIILKLIFKKYDGAWNGLIWLGRGTCGGSL